MKNSIFALICLLTFSCSIKSQPIEDQEKLIGISEDILTNLVAENYETTTKEFNEVMKDQLAPKTIGEVYKGLKAQIGEYKEKGDTFTDRIQQFRVVYIIMKFEKSPFKLKGVFDDEDKVAGLFLVPVNQM